MKFSKKNSCKNPNPRDVQYTIFVPKSNKHIGSIVKTLGEHFDHVITTTELCHDEKSEQDHCKKGTEITAIRPNSGVNEEAQRYLDAGLVLGIISMTDKSRKRPILRGFKDDLVIYNPECRSKSSTS